MSSGTMHDLMPLISALAHEYRVRIVMALMGGELCGCQLIRLLDLGPATISEHMSILIAARLVHRQGNSPCSCYYVAHNHGRIEVSEAIKLLSTSLSNDPQIRQDTKRLEQIRNLRQHHLDMSLFAAFDILD